MKKILILLASLFVCGICFAFSEITVVKDTTFKLPWTDKQMSKLNFILEQLTLSNNRATFYDLGDAGGFSGVKFNTSTTELEFYIDGTLMGTIDTTGAYTDEVP